MKIFVDVRTAIGPQPGVKFYTTRLLRWLPKVAPQHEYGALALKSLRAPISEEDRAAIGRPIHTPVLPAGIIERVWERDPRQTFDAFTRGCDLYHLTNYMTPVLKKPALVAVFHDLAWLRIPECYTPYGIAYFNRLLQLLVERATLILTISNSTRDDILEFTPVKEDKIRVIHLAGDHEDYEPVTPERIAEVGTAHGLRRPYYLMLGELCPKKNVPRTLEAYREVRRTWPDCPDMVLAGRDGEDSDQVQALMESDELKGAVHRLGYVPGPDVRPLLAGATALLYPSLYEGFGLPPLQAMQVGAPVITSNVASLPEVVGDAGLLVDPRSAGELAEAMREMGTNGALRDEMIRRGRERCRQFSWERTARETVAAYEEAMG